MNITIRNEEKKDISAIYNVNVEAFGDETEAKIIDKLREKNGIVLSLVAESDEEIIGNIVFSEVELDDENANGKYLGLAPMAVVKKYQRQGVGIMLVNEGLRIITEMGYDAVFVLGHPEYYPKFGFVPTVKYGIKCEIECPDEAFMVKEIKNDCLSGVHGQVKFDQVFNES